MDRRNNVHKITPEFTLQYECRKSNDTRIDIDHVRVLVGSFIPHNDHGIYEFSSVIDPNSKPYITIIYSTMQEIEEHKVTVTSILVTDGEKYTPIRLHYNHGYQITSLNPGQAIPSRRQLHKLITKFLTKLDA